MTLIILTLLIIIILLKFTNKNKKVIEKKNMVSKNKLTIEEFVEKYNDKKGLFKGGSLCFYGNWFGRPYDNIHELEFVTYDKSENKITMTFSNKQTLIILNPQNITETEHQLTIQRAERIIWKWLSLDEKQIEINSVNDNLTVESNGFWSKSEIKKMNLSNDALLWA